MWQYLCIWHKFESNACCLPACLPCVLCCRCIFGNQKMCNTSCTRIVYEFIGDWKSDECMFEGVSKRAAANCTSYSSSAPIEFISAPKRTYEAAHLHASVLSCSDTCSRRNRLILTSADLRSMKCCLYYRLPQQQQRDKVQTNAHAHYNVLYEVAMTHSKVTLVV